MAEPFHQPGGLAPAQGGQRINITEAIAQDQDSGRGISLPVSAIGQECLAHSDPLRLIGQLAGGQGQHQRQVTGLLHC